MKSSEQTAASRTGQSSYRRSAGTARGEARRQELLDKVVDDLAVHGLADYSLRRAARAAGTTHKVILYHFDGLEDLLAQALLRLRRRRIDSVLAVAEAEETLADRIRTVWPVLADDASGLRVIDQAIGLAMYDPERYAHLARDASAQYLVMLTAMCPAEWSAERKQQVAEMILAAFRGFLAEWRTTRAADRIDAGMAALLRALEREEATADPS